MTETPTDPSPSDLAKQRLILAAISLFSQKGLDGVSLRLINREAGARNNSALHYHFGNKLGVIKACIHYIQDWFDRAVRLSWRSWKKTVKMHLCPSLVSSTP